MAKTAIGEFCTLHTVFSSPLRLQQFGGCWEAVATPMAQKDAEGGWEGAAELKSIKWTLKMEAEIFCSPFQLIRLIICSFWLVLNWCWSLWVCWGISAPHQWRIFSDFVWSKMIFHKNGCIWIQERVFSFRLAQVNCVDVCLTYLMPDSQPCGIMQRQRPHPTSPAPPKGGCTPTHTHLPPHPLYSAKHFHRDKSLYENWGTLCSSVKPAEAIL